MYLMDDDTDFASGALVCLQMADHMEQNLFS